MIKQVLNQIKQYFGFSNSEAGGFLVLIFLLFILILLPFIYRILPVSNENNSTADQLKLDSLQKELLTKIDRSKSEKGNFESDNFEHNYDQFSSNKSDYSSRKLFTFDPNTLDVNGFKSLGLPEFLAERIEKYRNAGGKFKNPEDFKKIYGLLPATYSKLAPYIKIKNGNNSSNEYSETNFPDNNSVKSSELDSKTAPTNFKKTIAFDLNKADTTTLMTVKGIGSKLSQRIIKFRDNLGGFHSENQVREVFGLDSTVVKEILKYGSINSGIYHKIEINDANEIKHLYLKPYIAKAIIAYRQQHGKYNSIADLKNVKLLDEVTIEKIKPYLKF
jgi:competence protein ComEA